MNIQITIDFRAADTAPVCVAAPFNPDQPGALREIARLASEAANDALGRTEGDERFSFTGVGSMIEFCASCGWAVIVEVR